MWRGTDSTIFLESLHFFLQFLGRVRLYVESALWRHVCIVVVMEDPPPPRLANLANKVHLKSSKMGHGTTTLCSFDKQSCFFRVCFCVQGILREECFQIKEIRDFYVAIGKPEQWKTKAEKQLGW